MSFVDYDTLAFEVLINAPLRKIAGRTEQIIIVVDVAVVDPGLRSEFLVNPNEVLVTVLGAGRAVTYYYRG